MNTDLREQEGKAYVIAAILLAVLGVSVTFTEKVLTVSPNTQIAGTTTNSQLVKEVRNLVADEEIDFQLNEKGVYDAYSPEKLALAKNHKTLLFFKADWCPSCVTADQTLNREFAAIPKDLAILKVSYDTEIALRKKYGVTIQHTFVQVDAQGNLLTKWVGGTSLAEIMRNIK